MRTALVTGASRGIGRECVKVLAANGYEVYGVWHKSENAIKSLCGEVSCTPLQCDVRDCAAVAAAVSSVSQGVDILVNCAGISEHALLQDITEEMWDNMFSVSVKSVYALSRACLPHMIHQKWGRIISISSMWGQTGASCEVHYSAAKAAVIGFTKALAKETGLSGITVNCIAPGVIDTDMNRDYSPADISALIEETPMNRIGTPFDIARTVAFLADEKSDFITGQVIGVNGGFVI
ncbi:MAG: SDR family oxidoreductase [Ruminococcus sp.]|nr:SDR family oxidoreductase [Ruminococcus sp.]